MDGIIVVNKPKDYTSRDIVNIIGKVYGTKKVGHTGTLDPLATGVLVICINRATKIVELLTTLDKEYIATFEIGTKTDTLDSTGTVLESVDAIISKKEIESILKQMIKTYDQQVPIYSAIKINGKKLYQYAREGIEVELPKNRVTIFDLELLDYKVLKNKTIIEVRAHVSKGTYIRSLGEDIAANFGHHAIMTELNRTKQGTFHLDEAFELDDINKETPLTSIKDALREYTTVEAQDGFLRDIQNGKVIPNIYESTEILFINNQKEAVAIYQKSEKDPKFMKPFKMFYVNK